MSALNIQGSVLGNELQSILMTDEIVPGAQPSYQLCKTIYLNHPLGAKMAESPVKKAQSIKRVVSVPDSPEDRVKKAFDEEWEALGCTKHIFNLGRIARIYGVGSLVMVSEGTPLDRNIDYKTLPGLSISFNVYDPLNTSGSLVLNQDPTAVDFQKVQGISVAGKNVHRSRAVVLLNEEPIYIAYTHSAFGYAGRSVYQRALFPLKSFIQTMTTDDLVTVKAGVLIAKMDQPGSIIDNLMGKMFGAKRQMIKEAATGNVISVGKDDNVESLNFQNLHAPYELVRKNILNNIATSADMPAIMLENETLTEGFGEGKEDSKIIANYIDGIREWMNPAYTFCDKIVQYRAWNPEFYKGIQRDFPEEYADVSYTEAFYRWVNSFAAEWPTLLTEPESEKIKVEETKYKTIIGVVEALVDKLDPENKATLISWAADNLNANKMIFTDPLSLDIEALRSYEPPAPVVGEDGEDGAEPQPPNFADADLPYATDIKDDWVAEKINGKWYAIGTSLGEKMHMRQSSEQSARQYANKMNAAAREAIEGNRAFTEERNRQAKRLRAERGERSNKQGSLI